MIAFLQPKPDRSKIREEDRWLDYRDMFGGMWATIKTDKSVLMYDWDLRLLMAGFVTADGLDLPEELPERTQQVYIFSIT